MNDLLTSPQPSSLALSALDIGVRMLIAAALGSVVALLYRISRNAEERTRGVPQTLVLLAPLIAMVMMAVGNNVAAAFTLVGTLAIVRFRTVVRDTRDTVFVIFAVGVGMASGAFNLEVALVGTAVVGLVIVALRLLELRGARLARGSAGSLRLGVSPPDVDPGLYRGIVLRYASSVAVVKSSVDRATGQLDLRLSLGGADPERSPAMLAELLEVPEIVRAAYATDDDLA